MSEVYLFRELKFIKIEQKIGKKIQKKYLFVLLYSLLYCSIFIYGIGNDDQAGIFSRDAKSSLFGRFEVRDVGPLVCAQVTNRIDRGKGWAPAPSGTCTGCF